MGGVADVVSGIFGGSKKPSYEVPEQKKVEQTSSTPTEADTSVSLAAADERRKRQQAAAAGGTLLTSGTGAAGSATTQKKTLLG
ncbi:hypothetical protein LJC46_04315 [Desulfovibrio sp. OttesenSCG-928-G15]|nr:hypothetical protein [Desulfovibrio sp. OttesenSCG-928-G15]